MGGVVGILLAELFRAGGVSVFCSGGAEFLALPSSLPLLFKSWVTSIGMSLLVWVSLRLGRRYSLVLAREFFVLLMEVVMKGSFGSLGKEMVWFYFWSPVNILEQVLWILVYLVSDLSVCPRLFRECRFFFSSVFRTWRIFLLWGRFSDVTFR